MLKARDGGTGFERALVTALDHAVEGRLRAAGDSLDDYLYGDPNAFVAAKLSHAFRFMIGDADGMVGGVGRTYADVLKPAIQSLGTHPEGHCIVGCYVVSVAGRLIILADATVNIYPDQRTLAEIAVQTSRVARRFGLEPRVAMLSFSNFGTNREQRSTRLEEAVATARELDPTLKIDGPMQADTALDTLVQEEYPFLNFDGPANVLVCPNLAAANIAYKLLEQLADAEMIGPILEGTTFPVQIVARNDEVRDIVNMATLCVAEACRGDSYWETLRSTSD